MKSAASVGDAVSLSFFSLVAVVAVLSSFWLRHCCFLFAFGSGFSLDQGFLPLAGVLFCADVSVPWSSLLSDFSLLA